MTFLKKALGTLLSLNVALLAPAAAWAQTSRAPVVPVAPTTLAVPLALPVLPALAPQASAVPGLATALGAAPLAAVPVGVATERPAAASALTAAALAGRPAPAATSLARDSARLDAFWSGSRGMASAAIAAPALLAAHAHALSSAHTYAVAGGVLAGTYGLHRAVRWGIDRLAAKRRWDPERVDNLHFIGTVVSWTLGAGVGIHLAGAATASVVAGLGLALSYAIKNSVSNVLQAVLFLARRPFLMGEKLRIGDKLYQVEDMQAQYVKLRIVARLLEDAPGKVPAGFAIVPLSAVDPLGREVNEKGQKFAQVRDSGFAGRIEVERWSYTLLAGKPLAIYRPYVDKRSKLTALRGLPARLASERWRSSLFGVVSALREAPRKKLVRAALWVGAAAALTPLWPVLQTHLTFLGVQALFPYAQGGLLFLATRTVSSFVDDFLPILSRKLGWSRQLFVVVKLLTQALIFLTGMSGALRALGLEWRSVLTSLGVPAAAMAFASGDILQSLTSGFMLRVSRALKIGEYYGVGTDGPSGVVQEMNLFHLVLKPAEGMHVLVPYTAVSDNPQRTLEDDPGAQPK